MGSLRSPFSHWRVWLSITLASLVLLAAAGQADPARAGAWSRPAPTHVLDELDTASAAGQRWVWSAYFNDDGKLIVGRRHPGVRRLVGQFRLNGLPPGAGRLASIYEKPLIATDSRGGVVLAWFYSTSDDVDQGGCCYRTMIGGRTATGRTWVLRVNRREALPQSMASNASGTTVLTIGSGGRTVAITLRKGRVIVKRDLAPATSSNDELWVTPKGAFHWATERESSGSYYASRSTQGARFPRAVLRRGRGILLVNRHPFVFAKPPPTAPSPAAFALGPDGRAVQVWTDASRRELVIDRLMPGRLSFERDRVPIPRRASDLGPSASIDGAGRTVIAWGDEDGPDDTKIRAVVLSRNGRLGRPLALSDRSRGRECAFPRLWSLGSRSWVTYSCFRALGSRARTHQQFLAFHG